MTRTDAIKAFYKLLDETVADFVPSEEMTRGFPNLEYVQPSSSEVATGWTCAQSSQESEDRR